jgi:hypothetical protein
VEAKRAGVGGSPDRKRAVKRTLEAAVEAGEVPVGKPFRFPPLSGPSLQAA